ncbi:MAG: hypothetical protein J6Y78_08600 [Paludibacteraceae bacterium]|nr:hypothetical protein [Paludibacteraceae bacterium]
MSGVLAKNVDKWIYIDVADQHPDSMRFIRDCESSMDITIEILRSEKYKDVADVCRQHRMINSPWGAACTGMLKKAVRKQWECEQYEKGITDLTYIWGYDVEEKKRAERIKESFPEFKHEFPLIDKGLSKEAVHGLFDRMFNFPRPKMYDMGYSNNNCVGCVKGGMGYWNKIRKDFPEVFKARAELEREIGHSCINGIFLDELKPDAGKMEMEIMTDCDILCHLAYYEVEDSR